MNDCPACQQAVRRTWAEYRSGCPGCRARALARSDAARNAWDEQGNGDTEAMTEAIGRLLPSLSLKRGWQLVFDWWMSDKKLGAKL